MRVLVIDNIDSFVYNLVQYIGELGMEPQVFTNDVPLRRIIKEQPDKIVISPGPKTPEVAGVSVDVVKEFSGKLPILGVCLGHQAVGYAFGADITPAKRLMHGKTCLIKHDDSEFFRGVPNPFEATRYHSLAVDRATLPSCLRVTAETSDEHREIMGVKHMEHSTFGVQFHPESILTAHGKLMIKNFVEL